MDWKKARKNNMIVKITKFLLRVEKWFLDKCIDKDTLEYEDYLYTIKNHEKEIDRISKESEEK